MRGSDHYTVAGEVIDAPGPEEYRSAFLAQTWLLRAVIRLEAAFRGQSVEEVVQRREYRVLLKRLNELYPGTVDTMIPALREGSLGLIRKLSGRVASIRPIAVECSGPRSGAFLHFLLHRVAPEVERRVSLARTVPRSILENPTLTVKEANSLLRRSTQDALQEQKEEIIRTVNPYWQSIAGLHGLSGVPFRMIVPTGSSAIPAVPIRSAMAELIQLYRELEFCALQRFPAALDLAEEFAASRTPRTTASQPDIWGAIEEVRRKVPLLEIIRLGLEEPRIRIRPLDRSSDWWPHFERFVMTGLDAADAIQDRRAADLEELLKDTYAVVSDPDLWLPQSLYQRSVDAIRRVSTSALFRRTRVFVGVLAREEEILPGGSRKELLEAHVALDKHMDDLESLAGTGEKPGTLGETVRSMRNAMRDKVKLRIELAKVFSAHRPRVYACVQGTIDSLTAIREICVREKSAIMRRLPRISAVLGDAFEDISLRAVFDTIQDQYPRLALCLTGIMTIEQELSDPLDTEDQGPDSAKDGNGTVAPPRPRG